MSVTTETRIRRMSIGDGSLCKKLPTVKIEVSDFNILLIERIISVYDRIDIH